jgi:hypothetical protein
LPYEVAEEGDDEVVVGTNQAAEETDELGKGWMYGDGEEQHIYAVIGHGVSVGLEHG